MHTVGHFIREATEDLTHADSRVWHTLSALFFRPGHLTQEFFAGRRSRYLPPVRLYLVVSVLFFLLASGFPGRWDVIQFDGPARTQSTVSGKGPVLTALGGNSGTCNTIVYRGPMAGKLQPRLRAACGKILLDSGAGLKQSFLHNMPRAMFVFMPLIALFMMLLYWRPRRYYVEHLLFLIHNHAFVFLAGMAGMFVNMLPDSFVTGWLSFAGFLYFVWYFFRSVRVFYSQGRLRTIAKILALGLVYVFLAIIMLVFTAIYSAVTL